jgi:hypothetical protein
MPREEWLYPSRPLSGRLLRRAEVTAIALLYFPLAEADNAVEVCFLESGFRTDAWKKDGEDSRGLWQINVAEGAHPDLAKTNLFDPMVNGWYAAVIWRASGWSAWANSAIELGLI